MNEIIFAVDEAPEGGYTARALGYSVFTEGNDLKTLHQNVKEAVQCHFEEHEKPRVIRIFSSKVKVLEA
jgi:hypothetical protein